MTLEIRPRDILLVLEEDDMGDERLGRDRGRIWCYVTHFQSQSRAQLNGRCGEQSLLEVAAV